MKLFDDDNWYMYLENLDMFEGVGYCKILNMYF